MVSTILATQEAFGQVTAVEAPVGAAKALIAELAEYPNLAALVVEGRDTLLHVTAGGIDWRYGGWGDFV